MKFAADRWVGQVGPVGSRAPEESTGTSMPACPKLKNVVAHSLKERLVNIRHRSQ
jgi:hypothetical protein